jgi:hypothetical protein
MHASTMDPSCILQLPANSDRCYQLTPASTCADLHKIGGLHTLLELLGSQHPSLRWRAAEVVATCVQNNPPVQEVRAGLHPPGRR